MKALFLFGTPEDNKGMVKIAPNGETHFTISGSNNLWLFLKDLPEREQHLCLSGRPGNQDVKLKFQPDIIINEISDPDSHPTALNRAINLCAQQGNPVFNNPKAIKETRRDHIYNRLARIERLNIPKTVRFQPRSPQDVQDKITETELSYPVIFRQAGDHGGISTQLIHDASEIETLMYQYALDGRPYYMTNFVNYASTEDQLYRKYRLVVVGGIVYLRHLIISDKWLIHSSSRKFMAQNPRYKDEEIAALEAFDNEVRPKISSLVKQIADELQLDYFGIDCNMDNDGDILVFEINANMNILVNNQKTPNIWEKPIQKIKQHISNLILSKAEK